MTELKRGDLCRLLRVDYNWFVTEMAANNFPDYVGKQLIEGRSATVGMIVEVLDKLQFDWWSVWIPELNGFTVISEEYLQKL